MVMLAILMILLRDYALAGNGGKTAADSDADVTQVICNVINFVQKIGMPIMTGVILGSSIMVHYLIA